MKFSKKYIILSLTFLAIFTTTIVVANYILNKNSKSMNILDTTKSQDKIIDNVNIEQRYKEIIERGTEILNKEEIVSYQESNDTVKQHEDITSNTIEKVTKKVFKVPTSEATIFSTTALSGSYIQLGAFLKYPDLSYLNSMKLKGYKYQVYKVQVNGKFYHKVLIGPYSTQEESRLDLPQVRQDLQSSKAFIYQ